MRWHRVRAADKLAFREDLQSDPTLTDLQKRMISTIATHWNNEKMQAECSLTFIAAGAGTTKKMAHKYAASLADSGRVSIKRKPDYTTSTLWDVNWWLRGSSWVRLNNGGQPILDCRKESPTDAHGESPTYAQGGVPQDCMGGVPQAGDQFPSKEGYIGAPKGARPIGGAQGAPKKEKKESPHKAPAGFAKWKIVHAEYEGEDEDLFVAHMRSGKNSKFVLRCHVDSDDYESIDAALLIDGEPENVIGDMLMMSTNRTGAKEFLRAAPLPWREVIILAGETNEDGSARLVVEFHDEHGGQGHLHLHAEAAATLGAVCGGEESAIGARVRYRLMPDDSFEFRLVEAAQGEEAA